MAMMHNFNVLEALGWVGALLLVGAYALNSNGWMASDGLTYQLLNLAGSLVLMYYTYQKKAYPNTILNLVWAFIGLIAIAKIWLR